MAVYTEVSLAEAGALMARLGLGEVTVLTGIRSGIENTNYFVDTTAGRFVLTVFERLTHAQLPFYLGLMQHLAARGLPVPGPKADSLGVILHTVQGKPAAVVDRLRGEHHLAPDAADCERLGAMLARMHLAAADWPVRQAHLRGLAWWIETAPLIAPHLGGVDAALLDSELAYQQQLAASPAFAALPAGPIHADLFRDNVMFEQRTTGAEISGLFDFYFAGVDTWLFDIAVCANDWCTDLISGRLDADRAQALVAAYHRKRPLHGTELRMMPALMRAAALRFWISRLWDLHLPRDAALLQAHDPAHFERVLREHIATPWHAVLT